MVDKDDNRSLKLNAKNCFKYFELVCVDIIFDRFYIIIPNKLQEQHFLSKQIEDQK